MARIARVVVPGFPHHVTQRGSRRQQTFFRESDYEDYLALMAEWCKHCGVEIWCYCLMPNHVHLIARPKTEDGLRRGIGEAHRRYTRLVNFREGWRGYLWQGRFASYVLDARHLRAAARYIEMNPVRARLAARPEDYRWSSARAHLLGEDDLLVRVKRLVDIVPDWRGLLDSALSDDEMENLRRHERTGRPLGDEKFLRSVERKIGRDLHREKPGPKPAGKRR
jgi:putative transposase